MINIETLLESLSVFPHYELPIKGVRDEPIDPDRCAIRGRLIYSDRDIMQFHVMADPLTGKFSFCQMSYEGLGVTAILGEVNFRTQTVTLDLSPVPNFAQVIIHCETLHEVVHYEQ